MKKGLAMLLACTLLISGIPLTTAAQEKETQTLTPGDLTFRKVWTVRNMFQSKVTLDEMDFSKIQSGADGLLALENDQQGLLDISNEGETTASDRVLLGDHTPYGAYDVEVVEQDAGTDVKLELVKDENNKIIVTQTNEGADASKPVFWQEVTSLDMQDEDLLEKTGVYDDNPPYNVVSKIENGIRFEGGSGRGESFVPVASLKQGHRYEATVAQQTSGYANLILKFRKDSKNAIFFVQRSSGDCSYEIFKDGNSVRYGSFQVVTSTKPTTMSMEIQGGSIVFTCNTGATEEFSQKVQVSDVFDFTQQEVIEQFEFVIGGRIDPGQLLDFTYAGEYEKTEGEAALDTSDPSALTKYDDITCEGSSFSLSGSDGELVFTSEDPKESQEPEISLDMSDSQLLDKTGIYDDNAPYNQVSKTENGIRFEGGTGRGESFVPIASARQNYRYEAQVDVQTEGYANQIMKLRKDSKNAVFFVRRSDGTVSYEVFKDGISKTASVTLGTTNAADQPYTMCMEIQGENVVFKLMINGNEVIVKTVNVKEFFDLTDEAVLSEFEVVIGGRIDPGEAVEYTQAKAFSLAPSKTMESFVPVSAVRPGLIHEVTVNGQSNASAVIELREDSENSIRLLANPDGSMSYEMYKTGYQGAQNVGNLQNQNTEVPYKLRLEVQNHAVVFSRVSMDGEVLASVSYDVSEKFNLSDTKTLEGMEFAIGARSSQAGEVRYSDAKVWYQEKDPEEENYYGQTKLEVYKNGTLVVDTVISEGEFTVPYTLRADFSAKANVNGTTPGEGDGLVNVWRVEDGEATLLAGNSTMDFSLKTDFSRPDVVEQYQAYLGIEAEAKKGVSISQVCHYLTGGAGQADPKPLHNQKGEILQEDGKIWIAMTTRGYSINSSYQGIYELDLKTNELTLVGSMAFNLCQGQEKRYGGYHASDIIYNEIEDEWIVVTTSHINNHQVNSGILEQDPRTTAFQFVDVKKVDYPGTVRNEEDASLIYDEEAGKWRLVMCMQGAGGYQLPLFEADTWDGSYQEIGRSAEVPCTGIQLQKLDGQYYIFFGRGTDNCEALYYPEMTKAATLNIQSSPRSYNVWPVILPLKDEDAGITRYFMLSFDRDGHTNQHSYGNLYLYEAEQYSGMPVEETDAPIENTEPIVDGKITSVQQLLQIRNDLSGNYTLEADLDLSEVEDFVPIGNEETPFTGTFDGNGHVISNLSISRGESTDVGLFGCIGENGTVSDLTIRSASVEGRIYTGILAGYNQGTIRSCVVSGQVKTYAAGGGIAGQNTGRITASHSAGTVTSSGGDSVGGLVGTNSANIGTIALDKKGIVEQCTSSAKVSGSTNAGGLVGFNDCGKILDSSASGEVSGISYVGGFVGNIGQNYGNSSTSPVECCYAQGAVNAAYGVGGFAGYSDGALKQCFAVGEVNGQRSVGGLIGINNNKGNAENSFAIGTVTGEKNTGLLIGSNYGSFADIASAKQTDVLGNSPYTQMLETAPSLTSAATYDAQGRMEGYAKECWTVTEGALPVLADGAGRLETENYEARALAQEIYEASKEKKEADYTAESWQVFREKQETLREILENAQSSPESILQAAELLKSAQEDLVLKQTTTDVTSLNEALQRAEELDESRYTAESYAKVLEAVEAAKEIDLQDQEAINRAALAIWNAIAALEPDLSSLEEAIEEAKKAALEAQTAANEAKAAAEEAKKAQMAAEEERNSAAGQAAAAKAEAEAANKAKEAAELEAAAAKAQAEAAAKQAEAARLEAAAAKEQTEIAQAKAEAAEEAMRQAELSKEDAVAAKEAALKAKEEAQNMLKQAQDALAGANEAIKQAQSLAEASIQAAQNAAAEAIRQAQAEAQAKIDAAIAQMKEAMEAASQDKAQESGNDSQLQDKKGVEFNESNYGFRITKAAGSGTGTVTLTKVLKKTIKKATIPASVTYSGKKYKVTAVSAKAFKNCTKLTRVVIGKNVKTLGGNVFKNCKKLKTVVVKSSVLTKLGKKTFSGIAKNAVVDVPNKKISKYTRMMKKSGLPKTAKVK